MAVIIKLCVAATLVAVGFGVMACWWLLCTSYPKQVVAWAVVLGWVAVGLALRSVCNAHIRRIKGKRKEQADERSEG